MKIVLHIYFTIFFFNLLMTAERRNILMVYVLVIWPEGPVDLWQHKWMPCPLLVDALFHISEIVQCLFP